MPKFVSPDEYLARAKQAHGDLYRYDLSTLRSANAPARITCLIHGAFIQRLANHLRGVGCPACAGRGVDWVERFRSVHGERYDYSHVVFEHYKKPVRIICALHGIFEQTPDNHFRGKQGCPRCKGQQIRQYKQLSINEFINRAVKVHGGRFLYTNTQFDNMLKSMVDIVCPAHGIFKQSPVNHLAGKVGCTKCNNMASKGEDSLALYVGMFFSPVKRDRTVIKPKELDIYVPEKRLAVEYCGMYWHSLGTAEEATAKKWGHYTKYQKCQEKGVRLLTVYESEWQEHEYAIRRLLRNALGKTRGKLMARKCELKKVPAPDAKLFFDRYHPQGGDGYGDHYGLFYKEKLVACMRFAFGINDRGTSSRVWTLSRFATRITVAGAASRLFKAFVDEHHPTEVKSFSDNRYFSGDMYRAIGFTLEDESLPDYQVWSPKIGLTPKSHYQRRNIPKRLKEHGVTESFDPKTDPRSEAEMTYLMGARRIYDCGRKRWVWKAVDSSGAP